MVPRLFKIPIYVSVSFGVGPLERKRREVTNHLLYSLGTLTIAVGRGWAHDIQAGHFLCVTNP